jgi:ABC-type phosphate transport system auxiliary subunit
MSGELERRREAVAAELEAVRRDLDEEATLGADPNAAELAEVEAELAALKENLEGLQQEVRWRALRNERLRARPRQP